MSDSALRSLQRDAAAGDPHAEVKLYRARLRAGEFGRDARIVDEALDVACEGGEPCEATLEVLGLAVGGELAHGSWITLCAPSGGKFKLMNHGAGTWWCVLHWYQGQHACDDLGLRWLEHWAVCAAGRLVDDRRRGHNKYVSGWREGARTYGLRDGLAFLAERLDTTYKPGCGRALWIARKQLASAKGVLTRLVNQGRIGPTAYAERKSAQNDVESFEALVKKLESGE
jgi:hypothetical protein